jgi:hypothetical protein
MCGATSQGATINPMATEHILALLIAERDKLNKALDALGGGAQIKRRGRPPKSAVAAVTAAPAPTKKRTLSSATRNAQSERMKAYWAKKRKAT